MALHIQSTLQHLRGQCVAVVEQSRLMDTRTDCPRARISVTCQTLLAFVPQTAEVSVERIQINHLLQKV